MPFPIETTAARRDAFVIVIGRRFFRVINHSHLVSSVFDLAGVPASCAVRAAQMAICSPKLRMNRMAPTKRPAARSRFCETGGSETSGGEGEEGQGRAGWGSEPGSHGGARASRRGTGRGASGAHHGALSVGSGEFPLHEILDALDAHGRALGGLRGPDPRSVRWSSSLVVGRTRSDVRQRQQFSTRASALPFALESGLPISGLLLESGMTSSFQVSRSKPTSSRLAKGSWYGRGSPRSIVLKSSCGVKYPRSAVASFRSA